MENEIMLDDKNVLAMKLLHYFITEKNYNPIILQGIDNEIWLENLDEDCKVIRIVSGYIHNDEQYDFDVFKTKRIMKKIKRKTFSFNMNVMSFFLDMGDNVTKDINTDSKLMGIKVSNESDIDKSDIVKKIFPDISKKLEYNEEGVELFAKITSDINEHNRRDANRIENVFKDKGPYITYILIAINVLLYIIPILLGQYSNIINDYCIHGPSIRIGQYYRLITGVFLHGNIFHLFFNMYSLYIVGSQIENYLGRVKYVIIYLFSGLMGALFSMIFGGNVASIGASGAIFGLMGALLYFGYHYRVYLGTVLKNQLIPLIIFALVLGFILPGVDNFAHIGGLIGGVMVTSSLGIKDKSTTSDRINGTIITLIFTAVIIYVAFVYSVRG
ncbi:MAG: rhomboid family intramembrane serine protease [Bacilli bacterium]|nr:rhomboid family intramembrane serine protease [Bacilli bacterium]